MLKKTFICLITFLSAIYLFGSNLISKESYKDYFPLQVGNEWHYEWQMVNIGEFEFKKITDIIKISSEEYFVMKNGNTINTNFSYDTLRVDDLGRVWKYENSSEQIWLDFTADTTYFYIENSYYSKDTFEITVEKSIDWNFGNFQCDSCVSFWFDNPDMIDEESGCIYAPEVGLIHIQFEGPAAPKIELTSAKVNKKIINPHIDYFPLKVGNQWDFIAENGSYSYQITDSLYINNQLHYIFNSDTIRKDSFGRIWRYESGKEQIWLDFSAPTDSQWTYTENIGDDYNFAYSIDRVEYSMRTYFGNKDSCILIYWDTEELTDMEESNIFAPEIGIVSRGRWNYSAYVYQAKVNNCNYTDSINFYSYEPYNDTTIIAGPYEFPQIFIQLKENNFGSDSILIYNKTPEDWDLPTAAFVINDYVGIKSYELWFEPLKMEVFSNHTNMHILEYDTLYECYGKFKLNLKTYYGYNLIETCSQFFRGLKYVATDDVPKTITSFHLSQNYPNPFNPNTMISYQLPITSNVKLSVYNMLGQKVATLVNEKKNEGYHQVIWDASDFSSGVYFYKIEAGDFVEYRKCLLMK